ncbi:HlyC/CorC family transporter [Paenibacillus albiflavus]|uniref:HlyC/CorC family transporter n=1 Tax=Paenibacillus albiflavus TaxID=2545760 RepID=A0A4V2WNQ9_9BACL|nr:hemolysin family protein [Paenibacillus albiflavus]TCZ76372.1 HlyC/CorC family transporter [Paenibacillus albiflavus]
MDSDPIPIFISLLLVLLFVVINGMIVAAEYAFVKIPRSFIDTKAEGGSLQAKLAKHMMNNLQAYLSASELGIIMATLITGLYGEQAIVSLLSPLFQLIHFPIWLNHLAALLLALGFLTILHGVIGRQIPKMLVNQSADKIAIVLAIPMFMLYNIMRPMNWLTHRLSAGFSRMIGIRVNEEQANSDPEDEIRILMQEGYNDSSMNQSEQTLMDNIAEFAETNAKEIMIPRTEMVCLYANLPYEENKQISIQEMRTRYPVCDPDKDNIIGFVHIKDLMQNDGLNTDLRSLIRPVLSVPESMQISTLLQLMQKRKTKIALLIDEYGGTSGLVTAEDIIEEIVGDIQGELDEERPAIEMVEDGVYSVDGLMLIDQINELLHTSIDTDNYDTIGGWMYSQVEIPPRANQIVSYKQFEFIITEVDHLRVCRILIRRTQTEPYFISDEEVS